MTFSWIFEDPRREEDIPYDSVLERFRVVRDQIELRMRGWLEQPEEELKRNREEREHERRERMKEVAQREADREAAHVGEEGRDPFRRA